MPSNPRRTVLQGLAQPAVELGGIQVVVAAASQESMSLQCILERIMITGLPSLVYLSIEEIAKFLNPVLRAWIQHYRSS
jgi:hypothetical protein